MNHQEVKEILERYNEDKCTPEEKAFVETWYLNLPEDALQYPVPELEKDLDEINAKLLEHSRPAKIRLWPRIAVAAAVFIMVSSGLFFYIQQQHDQQNITANIYKNDIAPGENKALLTLADGSKISLDDEANRQVATQSGMTVTKTKAGQLIYTAAATKLPGGEIKIAYNTISTPRG
ncbi:MAG TPA: hypothetical protein VGC08_10330 [Pedobacter sp.]